MAPKKLAGSNTVVLNVEIRSNLKTVRLLGRRDHGPEKLESEQLHLFIHRVLKD